MVDQLTIYGETQGGSIVDYPMDQPIEREQYYDLILQARAYWESLEEFRSRRARSRDYYRNKPQEIYVDPETRQIVKEDDQVKNEGRIPYKMNMIRPIVKNLIGQYRSNQTQRMAFPRHREDNEAADMMTEALRYVGDVNRIEGVDAEQLEESLISGMYGWRQVFRWNPNLNRCEVAVDPIHPSRIFFNRDLMDKRMNDLRFIGEIIDMSMDEVVSLFAKNEADEEYLRELYRGTARDYMYTPQSSGFDNVDNIYFDQCADPNLCRVVCVWKREYRWTRFIHDRATATYEPTDLSDKDIAELNMRRNIEALVVGMPPPEKIELDKRYEPIWKAYFLTPEGIVLYKGDTPYWHESHPYTLGLASFLDGDIWGLVEDIIDPQRLINRITIAIDYMFGASAKGILMIPEDAIPEGMTIDDFANEWSKFNGVIKFKAKPGMELPKQIVANAIPAGMFNWMGMMQGMMKDVSGVQGPSTGDEPNAGTPASLYNQQVVQAQTTNRDYFDNFFDTRKQRDFKTIQLIAQYYTKPVRLATAGKRPDGSMLIEYNPDRVRNLDFDVKVTETADTPVVRQMIEQTLLDLMNNNRITLMQFLQLSSHPKADMIMHVIEKTNPLMQQMANQPISGDALGTDPTMGAQQAMSSASIDPNGQMVQQDPQQQLLLQIQQQAQAGDPDAIATLTQIQ